MRYLWLNSGRTNQRQKATVDVSSCYPMGTVLVVKHNFTKVFMQLDNNSRFLRESEFKGQILMFTALSFLTVGKSVLFSGKKKINK